MLSQSGDVFLRMVGEAGLDELDKRLASGAIATAEYEARKQEITALVLESDEYREMMSRAEDVAAKREGFFFEVAAGFVWDFAAGSWESRAFRKRGRMGDTQLRVRLVEPGWRPALSRRDHGAKRGCTRLGRPRGLFDRRLCALPGVRPAITDRSDRDHQAEPPVRRHRRVPRLAGDLDHRVVWQGPSEDGHQGNTYRSARTGVQLQQRSLFLNQAWRRGV